MVLGGLTLLGIAILLFAPLRGNLAIVGGVQSFVARLGDRFTPAEDAELEFLDCLTRSLAEIPDGADVQVDPIEDPYLMLRMTEAAFPRLRPLDTAAGYRVSIDAEPDPGAVVISETDCGPVTILVSERR